MSYSTVPVVYAVMVDGKQAGMVARTTTLTWIAVTQDSYTIGQPAKSKQAAISRVVRYAERQARNV